MPVTILRGNAIALPLADNSVDLIVTSPPYFSLRSYTDGGVHYPGQLGSESSPTEFIDALIDATREMVRVLKPAGSLFVNLGDKYAGHSNGTGGHRALARDYRAKGIVDTSRHGIPVKSLMGLPWRYAIRCIDELGLILRAEIIWAKPNGLPESVRDRVRRSHEQWFHFTAQPHYYSAIDEVREEHTSPVSLGRRINGGAPENGGGQRFGTDGTRHTDGHPLGKLPGSVWTIATEPLRVPDHLGIDHFAAFPTEWPRRIITGWSPRGVCVECGFLLGSTYDKGMLGVRDIVRGRSQGPAQDVLFQDVRESPHGAQSGHDEGLDADEQGVRGDACTGSPDGRQDGLRNAAPSSGRGGAGTRPPALGSRAPHQRREGRQPAGELGAAGEGDSRQAVWGDAAIPDRVPVLRSRGAVTGECPHCGSTETRQSVICDPFGGTGTTALVAAVLGRHGITVDMSADYCRLAAWRTGDEQQRAKVARRAGLVGSRPKRRRRIVDSAARGFEQGVLDIGGAS